MDSMAEVSVVNALTVDVEDYFQVSAFEPLIRREDWGKWPSRVERNTDALLEMFAAQGVKATFFTLGWIGERFPDLVRRIVGQGHELGCHGYEHIKVVRQSREQFREDIRRAKGILEEVAGVPLSGYRAASFSIGSGTLWALEEIEAAGFEYSSSIYPVSHDHYGMPDAPRFPFRPANTRALTEIPLSTARFAHRNWPAGGGGYFRLFPYALSRALIRGINEGEARSANFYLHPWEIDPGQPRPTGLNVRTRFRHYINQGRMQYRLRRLLHDFRWGTMREVFRGDIEANRTGRHG